MDFEGSNYFVIMYSLLPPSALPFLYVLNCKLPSTPPILVAFPCSSEVTREKVKVLVLNSSCKTNANMWCL